MVQPVVVQPDMAPSVWEEPGVEQRVVVQPDLVQSVGGHYSML